MAIKVKHEGSAASRLAAGEAGGAAKRAMEASALVKPTQIQTLAPAHASAPSPGGAHAQLIGALGGGAHAPLVGGGGGIGVKLSGPTPLLTSPSGSSGSSGSRMAVPSKAGSPGIRRISSSSGSGSSSGGGADDDYKVTGTSIFNRPDDESVWDDYSKQWKRPWLPGEKEAEALGRVGEVKNSLQKEILDYQHQLGMERAEQNSLLATEREINNARLRELLVPKVGPASIRSPFPNADGNSELQKQFDDIMSAIQESVDNAKSKGVTISPQQQKADGDPLRPIVDSVSANGAGTQPAPGDEIGNLYASGRFVFGESSGGSSRSSEWLRPPDMDAVAGGDQIAANEYAGSLGGMIAMLTGVPSGGADAGGESQGGGDSSSSDEPNKNA